ncbi:MAG: peptidoglycan DD-metalloendopeptidase family protein [Firmicutes bacterium]|nr:peptidoglycan DD-metalloendopeptidase family protein [Bacillota bacterium]
MDQVPAVPVVSEKEVGQVIELLCSAYTSDSENVRLLKVNLVEDIAGTPCTISPEAVCVPQEAASLLLNSEESHESRLLLASRYDETLRENEPPELVGFLPEVHVRTLEEVRAVESIPFDTNYTYNDKMWHAQSHVLVPGKAGEKEVTYHVTSENGKEIDRQIVEQTVLLEPVTQVVEKGTSRAPSIGTGLFVWPVADGGIVSQHFSGAHKGIDITMLGHRSPILAADSGVVVETGSGDRRGNYIVIYHGSYYTAYLHNSINYVSTGATVSRGQTIAQMGNTGRTFGRTGIHLHFEIRRSNGSTIWNSTAINPLTFF